VCPKNGVLEGAITIPVYGFGDEGGLADYLREGWPIPETAVRKRLLVNGRSVDVVSVYSDDLFLCPQCGRRHQPRHAASAPVGVSSAVHEDEHINSTSHPGVVDDAKYYARLRAFGKSRLTAKEFYFKECEATEICQEIRQLELKECQRKMGGLKEYRRKMNRLKSPLVASDPALLKGPSPEIERANREEPDPPDVEFVYLVRGGEYYKIGIAKDTSKRLLGIRTGCPFPVELVKSWETDSAQKIERLMHCRFKAYRANGEWFRLPIEIIEELKAVEKIGNAFRSGQQNE